MAQNPFISLVAKLVSTTTPRQLTVDANGYLLTAAGIPSAPNYPAAKAATIFLGANQAGATTSVALATTYTGLCLSNPAGSGKNLSLIRAAGVLNVAPAALTGIGLIVGYAAAGIVIHTTPVTPLNSNLGGAAPVGLVDAACTLVGTPAWGGWLGETPTTTGVTTFDRTYDGAILIPPGGYVAIGTTIAGPAAALLASLTWQEIAV